MSLLTLGILAAAAAVACALFVPFARRLALRWGAMDVPDERRVHHSPTPRLGGVAVVVAAVVVLAGAGIAGLYHMRSGAPAFFAGALMVLALGVVDDVKPLGPRTKLLVEIVAAGVVVLGGGCRVDGISGPDGVFFLGAWGIPITILWVVLVTNALNLIDGIDGLAAGTATIAFVSVAVIARGFDIVSISIIAAILAGACLGFLVHNFHPASIFLGDSGSLTLGFALGVLSTYARAKGTTGAITLATLLVVALPLGDALMAIQRRYRQGLTPHSVRSHLAGFSRIFEADRNHLHHRLLRAGLSQRNASVALYAIQALACAGAVYLLVRG